MTFLAARVRTLLLGAVLAIICALPVAAQEQGRGFYKPAASDTIHSVAPNTAWWWRRKRPRPVSVPTS